MPSNTPPQQEYLDALSSGPIRVDTCENCKGEGATCDECGYPPSICRCAAIHAHWREEDTHVQKTCCEVNECAS